MVLYSSISKDENVIKLLITPGKLDFGKNLILWFLHVKSLYRYEICIHFFREYLVNFHIYRNIMQFKFVA